MSLLPLATALGASAGLVLGLTGAGGGVLAVPLLVFGLGLSIPAAAPVALLAVGLAAALGATLGLRQHIVRYRAAGLIAACGIVTAPLGLWLSHRLPAVPLALCFAGVQALVSVRLWRGANCAEVPRARCPCRLDHATGRLHWTLPCARALAATGVLAGLLSGLLGVGGGFVIVPALRRFTDLEMNSLVATSLAVIAVVALATGGATVAGGLVDAALALPFALGTAAGLLLGRWLAPRLGGPRLQKLFAVVGLAAALALLARSHICG
ncbi:sulfite exporter TauE/SafE family protein [Pseudomonas entomophila]|uniref:sulfite exporter TauE/SafE family protein n=1 Tax=Pseudomonas sp. RIT-PI-S TaxID=3035295 RepID=UPI0021DA92FD